MVQPSLHMTVGEGNTHAALGVLGAETQGRGHEIEMINYVLINPSLLAQSENILVTRSIPGCTTLTPEG
jgi:hypothetical protein